MPAIDYPKYENMSRRQLISALDGAEKKTRKLKEKYEENLKDNLNLIAFLKSKISESLNEPKYYALKDSPAIKKIEEWEKQHPQEVAEIDNELDLEMQGYQNGNQA